MAKDIEHFLSFLAIFLFFWGWSVQFIIDLKFVGVGFLTFEIFIF